MAVDGPTKTSECPPQQFYALGDALEVSCTVRMYPEPDVQRWQWGVNGDHLDIGAGDKTWDDRVTTAVEKVGARAYALRNRRRHSVLLALCVVS